MTSRFVCQDGRILLGVGRRARKIIPKLMGGKVIRGVWDYQSEMACSAKIEYSSLSILVQINV